MSENETKWSCEYCTYENYPSSIKCTMCRGSKPFISEDIYTLHGDESTASGPCEKIENTDTLDDCNYMNITNNIDDNSLAAAKTLHEHIQSLRVSQYSDLAQSLSQSRNNSPTASLTNIENARRTSQTKWICTVSFERPINKLPNNKFLICLDVYL